MEVIYSYPSPPNGWRQELIMMVMMMMTTMRRRRSKCHIEVGIFGTSNLIQIQSVGTLYILYVINIHIVNEAVCIMNYHVINIQIFIMFIYHIYQILSFII